MMWQRTFSPSTRHMKKHHFLLIFLLLASAGIAQEEDTRPIEEVLIEGHRSGWTLRYQMIEAADEVYSLFNEIYQGTDYEMQCTTAPLIKDGFTANRPSPLTRNCTSAFVREQQQEALQEMIADDFAGELNEYVQVDMDQHAQELSERILALYRENAQFREKFDRYSSLKAKSESN